MVYECHLFVQCLCVVFNDTATTEIYTYGHTLSLHDALPIYRLVRPRQKKRRAENFIAEASALQPGDFVVHIDHGIGQYKDLVTLDVAGAPHDRSEEHTSELQSLMRISYAVFCLKKKKNTQNTT